MSAENPTPRPEPERYLVAFSFAGEQRELVRQIAEATEQLLGWGTVFFDEWFEGQKKGARHEWHTVPPINRLRGSGRFISQLRASGRFSSGEESSPPAAFSAERRKPLGQRAAECDHPSDRSTR